MTWEASADVVEFDEAIAWFFARVSVTKDVWELLNDAAREQAFTVAGVAQLDLVSEVFESVKSAIAKGTDFRTFQKAALASLEAAWSGSVADPAWRLQTIFRTNLQSAYSRGRYQQATDPDVLTVRPYWLFDAVLDGRITAVCKACDGKVLPADDPWWSTHVPPLHFQCRSTITTLTKAQAKQLGITKSPPSATPGEGFGRAPTELKAPWKPEKDDYPEQLWLKFEAKNTRVESKAR